MSRHYNGNDSTPELQSLVDDDAFLTALSRGEDPSGGSDPLAAMLLELRDDVHQEMPPAPVVKTPARHKRPHPLLAGLVGAAAATVIVAGSGAALYNATPGSPLWGASTAVFGERTSVVELASTLEELEVASAKGDVEGARNLLNQARALVNAIGARENAPAAPENPENPENNVTVTVTETRQPQAPAPVAAEPSDNPQPASEPAATVTQTCLLYTSPSPRDRG